MEIQNIEELLLKSGYIKSNFNVSGKIIDIPNVFIKDDKEAYLILDYNFMEDKIIEYQRKILWFQNFSINEIIKYNINMIITYKSSQLKKDDDIIENIMKYERDVHICRKLFVDLDYDNSISVLPFLNINSKSAEDERNKLIKDIAEVIKNHNVYTEIIKDKPDFSVIEELFDKEIIKNE